MTRTHRPSLALILAVSALAAIAVYLPALPGGFLSDDYSLLHPFHGADARERAARVGKTFLAEVGRLKAAPLWVAAADREAPGAQLPPAVPDRFFCWSSRSRALVPLSLAFAPGFGDWNDVWARALDAAGCRA